MGLNAITLDFIFVVVLEREYVQKFKDVTSGCDAVNSLGHFSIAFHFLV